MYSTPPIVDLIKGECDNYKPQAKTHIEVNGLFMNSSYNLHVARSTTSFVDSRYRVTCTGQDTESCAPEEPCRFRVPISCRIHSQIGRRTDVIPHASHNHTSWSDAAESCDSSRRNNIVDRQHFLVRDKILNTDLTTTKHYHFVTNHF